MLDWIFVQERSEVKLEVAVGVEPTNGEFAVLCLTTWLRHHFDGNKKAQQISFVALKRFSKFIRKPLTFEFKKASFFAFLKRSI
jgi:hypothetical protein